MMLHYCVVVWLKHNLQKIISDCSLIM